ncbi:hypothetical protein [Endozoicomonas sp. 4G]|uniref:hypothetical protein n=1 Tax=Endozoicomonas sp. 4G TaxID=2872754 RepID=UPI002078FB63|nr:hypothetical protein [Endozoicomonas sp. 4G]
MKTKVRLIILLFFCLLSSYSKSKEVQFNWNLYQYDKLLFIGTATTSIDFIHSRAVSGFNPDEPNQLCASFSGNHFCTYEVTTTTNVVVHQYSPDNNMPDFFRRFLGGGRYGLTHKSHMYYKLKGQTSTTTRNIAEWFCCVFCNPCFTSCERVTQDILNQEERVKTLGSATPNHLPEHVTLHSRSVAHKTVTHERAILGSSSIENIDVNSHIVDLFLNTPETQQWMIDNLNPSTTQTLNLIIPGLINTSSPATILVQEQNSEDDGKPSHFVSLSFLHGLVVKYHLKKLSSNNIQVLAVVVSINGYTLALTINNYNVLVNQPPPHYEESQAQQACDCQGACNCPRSGSNDTDESGNQGGTIRSVFFSLGQSK